MEFREVIWHGPSASIIINPSDDLGIFIERHSKAHSTRIDSLIGRSVVLRNVTIDDAVLIESGNSEVLSRYVRPIEPEQPGNFYAPNGARLYKELDGSGVVIGSDTRTFSEYQPLRS